MQTAIAKAKTDVTDRLGVRTQTSWSTLCKKDLTGLVKKQTSPSPSVGVCVIEGGPLCVVSTACWRWTELLPILGEDVSALLAGAGRTVRSPHSSVLADAAHNKKMFFFNFTFFSLILLLLVEWICCSGQCYYIIQRKESERYGNNFALCAVNDLVLWWGTFICLCFIPLEFILHHFSYFISLW